MAATGFTHRPVLLEEALAALHIRADGIYLDGTFGRGGHAGAVLERLGPDGRLLALDRDPEAARCAAERFGDDTRFLFEGQRFGKLVEVAERHGLWGRVNGLLLDLGVSSPQLDDRRRGFSFLNDGPLDMRMDPHSGPSAAEWLATADEGEIAKVLWELGEERYSRRIARAIVERRAHEAVATTGGLALLIAAAVPTREPGKHPATRSFQAIRIFINHELDELSTALAQAPRLLAKAGRLVVISFHSLEDRIVKRFMRDQARGPDLPPGLPVTEAQRGATLRLVGRAQRPGAAEVAANPRARSAVMRVAERC